MELAIFFELLLQMFLAVWRTCFEEKLLAPVARQVRLLVLSQLQVARPVVLFPETLQLPREVEKKGQQRDEQGLVNYQKK